MRGQPSLARKVAGFGLLFLGVLGLVLPILQGALFLALGCFVLRDQFALRDGRVSRVLPNLLGRVVVFRLRGRQG